MICGMQKDSEILLDNEVIYQNGKSCSKIKSFTTIPRKSTAGKASQKNTKERFLINKTKRCKSMKRTATYFYGSREGFLYGKLTEAWPIWLT